MMNPIDTKRRGIHRRTARGALAAVSALALVLAACGGSNDAAPAPSPSPQAPAPSAPTPEAPPFYEGKTIKIVVGAAPGGGSSRAAQLVADFLTEYVPGNPRVLVENIESASGAVVVNSWLNSMPDDGTVLMMTSGSVTYPWLLGDSIVEFDYATMQLVWANPNTSVIMARKESGLTSAQDLFDMPAGAVYGGRGPELSDMVEVLGFEVLGIQDDLPKVWGYGGGGAVALAFEQSEITLMSRNPSSLTTESGDIGIIEDGDADILYTRGRPGMGTGVFTYGRDFLFPEYPTLEQVYFDRYGSLPSGDAWDAFNLVTGLTSQAAYGIWFQPSVPSDRVEIIRAAIAEFVTTDRYIEQHAGAIGEPVQPIAGADLPVVTGILEGLDKNLLSWLRNYLRDKHGVVGIGD